MNRDQVKTLQTAYGKDSKLWVGKYVKLTAVTLQGKETVITQSDELPKTEAVQ